jgi:hypothetical protein
MGLQTHSGDNNKKAARSSHHECQAKHNLDGLRFFEKKKWKMPYTVTLAKSSSIYITQHI